MYQNKIALTPQDILEKDFKIDTRGYRLKEVDQFLDIIIGDYEQFFKMLRHNEKEKEELLDEITRLKQELRNLRMKIEIADSSEESKYPVRENTNIDIMKRLSQLEKIVYGKEE